MDRHCCEDMRREVERACEQHPDRFDCPDCLVQYWSRLREYGLIIHDGGSSVMLIRFCPWCGSKLPDSLREGE
jgi:ribosomal protein S27AE